MATQDTSTAELQADIAETRQELGETLAAVAQRADPKVIARAKVDDAKARIGQRPGPVVAVVVVTIVLVAVRRRRRRSR